MKILIPIFCFFIVSSSATAGCGNKNDGKEKYLPKDSFNYHFKILDSIKNANPYDTSMVCIYSVQYMEKTTGIKAHPDGDYIGWKVFTRKDLIAWKEWYEKNKEKQFSKQ